MGPPADGGRVGALMIPGVILAGGASSRMGRPKALLPIGTEGETFLSRVAATLRAANLDDVLVVVSPDLLEMSSRLPPGAPPLGVVVNTHPERGQLSSLLAALRVVDRPGVNAMLVTLVDVPLVSVETVTALLAAHRRTAAPIVRPARRGRHGHPVIFGARVFADLRRANPELGAKSVLREHASEIVDVDVDDAGAFIDIDTPEAYRDSIGRELPEI